MGDILYPHNRKAYEQAAAMLLHEGRAAVIHPTGTGKSFIGFQLCADQQEQRICWLSPSEYIFRTQWENWTRAGGIAPENLTFLTYAKLALMEEAELEPLQPAYIILDEFHRCGAEQWGQGVQRLLSMYPNAKLLGLSATHIRYLDNQRDMAEELFDGCIAAQMTLGEAIVQGILTPPRYVLTAYQLQRDLQRYERRVRGAKSAETRERAGELLEALRRSLAQAEGLDVIFRRHLTETSGKYIVFCTSTTHMDELLAHVPQWFGGIDPAPQVYRAYAENPASSRAFAAFKADDSEHLKLLFCIDMLNEGIHVDDVDGVILFRPTVSPIVYKQQIGRALSAGSGREPVILDVVNNIENLYSIAALRQELDAAAAYFRFRGEGERIVNDGFRVIDELRDCRALFAALEESLTASWDMMYRHAKTFYEENGHLNVPKRYKTPEGWALGNWILTQRGVRNGSRYGTLTPERIAKLDAIGMVWEDMFTNAWRRWYALLQEYQSAHGDLLVPANYVTEDGQRLGDFVSNLRTSRAMGRSGQYLSDQRIAALDALGMIWDAFDYRWEQSYLACAAYRLERGDLDVPGNYVTRDGLRLGAWLNRQRKLYQAGKLAPDQQRRLNQLGICWEGNFDRRWEYGYRQAKKWYAVHGNLDVPATYVDEDGFLLGRWVGRHLLDENGKSAIRITAERKKKLDALGMRWTRDDPWEVRYALAKKYYEVFGNLNVPAGYVSEGVWLNKWLNEQKQIYRGRRAGKKLTESQVSRLEGIGMQWYPSRKRTEAAQSATAFERGERNAV